MGGIPTDDEQKLSWYHLFIVRTLPAMTEVRRFEERTPNHPPRDRYEEAVESPPMNGRAPMALVEHDADR